MTWGARSTGMVPMRRVESYWRRLRKENWEMETLPRPHLPRSCDAPHVKHVQRNASHRIGVSLSPSECKCPKTKIVIVAKSRLHPFNWQDSTYNPYVPWALFEEKKCQKTICYTHWRNAFCNEKGWRERSLFYVVVEENNSETSFPIGYMLSEHTAPTIGHFLAQLSRDYKVVTAG